MSSFSLIKRQTLDFINTVVAAYCGHGYCGQPHIVNRSPGTEFCPSEIRRIIWTAAVYCGQAKEVEYRIFINEKLKPNHFVAIFRHLVFPP